MKIRDKLLLGFGLYILLAVILGFFAYRELRTIGARLSLVETADDITNTILEIRRYEKNYLLYKDEASLTELKQYLAALKEDIGNIEAEIVSEIGSGGNESLRRDIADYERLIEIIAANIVSQGAQAATVRNAGRTVERRPPKPCDVVLTRSGALPQLPEHEVIFRERAVALARLSC
jgi:hypothetical protein